MLFKQQNCTRLYLSNTALYTLLHRPNCPHAYCSCSLPTKPSQEHAQKYFLFDVSRQQEQTQRVCLCSKISLVSLFPSDWFAPITNLKVAIWEMTKCLILGKEWWHKFHPYLESLQPGRKVIWNRSKWKWPHASSVLTIQQLLALHWIFSTEALKSWHPSTPSASFETQRCNYPFFLLPHGHCQQWINYLATVMTTRKSQDGLWGQQFPFDWMEEALVKVITQ